MMIRHQRVQDMGEQHMSTRTTEDRKGRPDIYSDVKVQCVLGEMRDVMRTFDEGFVG